MNLYGQFLAIGLIIGLIIFYLLCRKLQLYTNKIIENIFVIFFIGLIGARITYIILYYDQFQIISEYFQFWQGGLVSFGGIICGLISAFFVFEKKHLGHSLDILSISFLSGWFFGRIGGFLTQNAVGVKSNLFNILFYNRVPIQLFEAMASLIIVILGVFFLLKFHKLKKRNYQGFLIFFISLILYCLSRFIIDFWRDQIDLTLGLGLGQIVSIIILLCCIIVIKPLINKKLTKL